MLWRELMSECFRDAEHRPPFGKLAEILRQVRKVNPCTLCCAVLCQACTLQTSAHPHRGFIPVETRIATPMETLNNNILNQQVLGFLVG